MVCSFCLTVAVTSLISHSLLEQLGPSQKAVLWFFKIPQEVKNEIKQAIKAERQLFVSRLTGDYIYSIASTQFENQDAEQIRELLARLVKSIDYGKIKREKNEICN